MDLPGFTWIYIDLHEFIWIYMDLHGFIWAWSFLRLFWALFRHVSKEASNGHGRFGGSVCQGSLLTCLKQQGSSLTRLQQQDSALTPLASISAYFHGSFKFTWLLWGQPLPRFPFDTLLAASFFLGTFAAVF